MYILAPYYLYTKGWEPFATPTFQVNDPWPVVSRSKRPTGWYLHGEEHDPPKICHLQPSCFRVLDGSAVKLHRYLAVSLEHEIF